MQRARGWDGAPAWATLTGDVTTCTLGGVREVSPAVASAFQNFYDDKDGVQGHPDLTASGVASLQAAKVPGG